MEVGRDSVRPDRPAREALLFHISQDTLPHRFDFLLRPSRLGLADQLADSLDALARAHYREVGGVEPDRRDALLLKVARPLTDPGNNTVAMSAGHADDAAEVDFLRDLLVLTQEA